MNIVLIGYRGSGKSTVGRRVAELLNMPFVDSDTVIVERAGRTIKEIFEAEGEAGFRDREAAVIQELAQRSRTVIAAGGGAILRPENVAAMRSAAKVIWLQADPETLHARILADAATSATRPNLTSAGGIEEIRRILEKRLPLYTAAAHETIHIGRITQEEAARQICALIGDGGSGG